MAETAKASETVQSATTTRCGESSKAASRASRRRKRAKKKKCAGPPKWECEDEKLWRLYMKMYADDARKRIESQKQAVGEFYYKSEIGYVPRAPDTSLPTTPFGNELSAFNVPYQRTCDDERTVALPKRIYDKLRDPCLTVDPAISNLVSDDDFEWPRLWPCSSRDEVRERKILERKKRMKKMGAIPCDIDEVDSPGTSDDERLQELANLKELTHARIPVTSSKTGEMLQVDRSCGDRPNLVEGDYVTVELASRKDNRTYASVSLRGLAGMHLVELQRMRERTWKFCMYQALVALLAKTQLRYKYAWSANIDYIYEHAWMLFLHVGTINVRPNQRFDDLLVYNYKYSVELELVQELNNIPVVTDINVKYFEKTLERQRTRPRKELTLVKADNFGSEKSKDKFRLVVHKGTKMIEKWFDQLEDRYTNCVFRTTRFSLAFWQDGSFWYLYNPYRCDKYALWNDQGAACVTKFCTRDGLKRHLMLLTLRAYVFNSCQRKRELAATCQKEKFSIQIYQLLFHSCQIHNVKLLTRSPRKPKTEMVRAEKSDDCSFDPLAHLTPKPCDDESSDDDDDDDERHAKTEKSRWVRDLKITWTKCSSSTTDHDKDVRLREKWHMYDVIEPRRLYVLWGEIHVTNKIFAEENRNRQDVACYAVFAGMALVNAPEYWSFEALNAVVVCGDKFYTERRQRLARLNLPSSNDPDNWNLVPNDQFRIGEFLFDLTIHPQTHGRLFLRTDQNLWRSLDQLFKRHSCAILCCESARVAILKHCGAYYVCDVRSYGPPIYDRGHGSAYLLRISCYDDVIKCLVLIIGSPECSKFTLRPLEIVKVVDLGEDECERKMSGCEKETKCASNKCGAAKRGACPFEDDKKKARKKGRRSTPRDDEEKDNYQTVCKRRVDRA